MDIQIEMPSRTVIYTPHSKDDHNMMIKFPHSLIYLIEQPSNHILKGIHFLSVHLFQAV